MLKKLLPIVLILLLALVLRVYQLTAIPPGLTHDEANHGREAIEILDGILLYYFPLNYGSEPLYSYTVAGFMALIGEGIFALRFVNVIFGLAAIAATYMWTKQVFDKTTALIAALLIAISFWPLASSREALRAGMLPFFMLVAIWFFWRILYGSRSGEEAGAGNVKPIPGKRPVTLLVIGFAISIVTTLHIYLAARVAWLLFPVFLIYLGAVHKPAFQRSWKPVVAGLLLAAILSVPMFIYLAQNPQAQTRLSMLGSTLEQVQQGNLRPVVENSVEALLAFVWPGFGDQFLAYNIPGRPVFDLVSAVFFVAGLMVCIWRWKRPAYAFLLFWFLIGILPSLVTGSTANTTRNLAALPVVFILPALGFVIMARGLADRFAISRRAVLLVGASAWLFLAGLASARDYFVIWSQMPEVRGAYQHTLVEALDYLDQKRFDDQPLTLSTVYPGAAHDPSIALVLSGADSERMRWVDARHALLLPPMAAAVVIVPDSTPYHAVFQDVLRPMDRINLRSDDLDPGFTVYEADGAARLMDGAGAPLADFGGAVQLLQARWLSPQVGAGDTAELLTVWQVVDPALAGPIHPPTRTTDVVFFTHVLDEQENILAQQDALDAPSWDWRRGDILMQVHTLTVPAGTEPGDYAAAVGIYDRLTGARLPIRAAGDEQRGDVMQISPLRVARSR